MKFSPVLFEIGDAISITDGEHKGLTGKVVDWLHIGTRPSDVDTIHKIELDEPVATTARKETPQPDGSKVVREEQISLTHVEVPASDLAMASSSAAPAQPAAAGTGG
jgi:ribosomal protein L24